MFELFFVYSLNHKTNLLHRQMDCANKSIKTFQGLDYVILSGLFYSIKNKSNVSERNSSIYKLEQIIITHINNVKSLKCLFEYGDMTQIIQENINVFKIMNEASYSTDKSFIYLFDKLLCVFGKNKEYLKTLFFRILNYSSPNNLRRLKFLVNHDAMQYFVTMNDFSHGENLLSVSYELHTYKFICVLQSKFMTQHVFDSTKIKGFSVLEYVIMKKKERTTMFLDSCSKNRLHFESEFVFRIIERHTCYDDVLMSLINLGFITRNTLIQNNKTIKNLISYVSSDVRQLLYNKNILTFEECLNYKNICDADTSTNTDTNTDVSTSTSEILAKSDQDKTPKSIIINIIQYVTQS